MAPYQLDNMTQESELSQIKLQQFTSYIAKGHIRGDTDAAFLTVSRSIIVDLFSFLLERVQFDEEYYRNSNPDLASAEKSGQITSLHTHYMEHGYFENRLPCRVDVDVAFYTETYPDVGDAVIAGRVASPAWHFETFGFREGRLPRQGWQFADLVAR